jgi:RNA polymerase sigma factor (sigma-70 family)
MKKEWVLTEEALNKFLAWLHPERDQAAIKYEAIRRRLVIIFSCKGCADAEDLADETINRVIRRAQDMADTYQGEPAPYFITVANNLYLEHAGRRSSRLQVPDDLPAAATSEVDDDRDYECLERCMERLAPADHRLVVQYYQEEKQARIDNRKELAKSLGIGLNALRIRAYRVRAGLQSCVNECVNSQ